MRNTEPRSAKTASVMLKWESGSKSSAKPQIWERETKKGKRRAFWRMHAELLEKGYKGKVEVISVPTNEFILGLNVLNPLDLRLNDPQLVLGILNS